MLDLEEFRGYLVIDKLSLDTELEQQAQLLGAVSDEYADAVAERDRLKEMMATTDARLDYEIRQVLEAEETKATEAMVKSLVQTDTAHRAAASKWLAAKLRADRLQVLKEAFKERGQNVRELCSLFVTNYFEKTSVEVKGDASEARYRLQRAKMAVARAKAETE